MFRALAIELRMAMSESDLLFTYLNGLKESVQSQVMLTNPATLDQAMIVADRADSTFWFAGVRSADNRRPPPLERRPLPQDRRQYTQPRRPTGNGVVPMELGVQ